MRACKHWQDVLARPAGGRPSHQPVWLVDVNRSNDGLTTIEQRTMNRLPKRGKCGKFH
ncbi:MAG: hypothetical protein ACFFD4_03450 [Candidatus Odinarchaeota archaeon]